MSATRPHSGPASTVASAANEPRARRAASCWSRGLAPLVTTLLGLAFAGCAASDIPESAWNSEAVSTDRKTLDAAAVLRGLSAAPSSPERRAAADSLRVTMQTVYGQMPPSEPNQKMTQTLIGYTLDYLESGKTCEPSQKIRLHRGIGGGSQPVIRDKADAKTGVHVFKAVTDAIRKQLGDGEKVGPFGINGVQAFESIAAGKSLRMRVDTDKREAEAMNRSIARTSRVSGDLKSPNEQKRLKAIQAVDDLTTKIRGADLGWSYYFGFERTVLDPTTNARSEIRLDLDKLTLDHTLGAEWNDSAGSPFSPLISTTLSTALDLWGPKYLVLDVCPERAAFVRHFDFLDEEEVYVPLFLLPEEIVDIAPSPEALATMDPPRDRALSQAYRNCYHAPAFGGSAAAGRDAYYEAVAQGLPLDEFRRKVQASIVAACPAQ